MNKGLENREVWGLLETKQLQILVKLLSWQGTEREMEEVTRPTVFLKRKYDLGDFLE